jgi:hypothetical protein
MGFSIGRVFRGVTRALSGGLGGIVEKLTKGPLGGLMKPLQGILGKVLEKTGLGKVLGKAMDWLGKLGPLASLAGGPLGMIGGLLGKMGGLSKIADFAKNLLGKLGGAQALPLPGLNNLTEMFAQRHAQLLQSILK